MDSSCFELLHQQTSPLQDPGPDQQINSYTLSGQDHFAPGHERKQICVRNEDDEGTEEVLGSKWAHHDEPEAHLEVHRGICLDFD
jgi:hypothetical protein